MSYLKRSVDFVRMFFFSTYNDIDLYFDLEFISKKDRNLRLKRLIKQLSKIDVLRAIVDVGGQQYRPGVSDVDWVCVVKKSGDFRALRSFFLQMLHDPDYKFLFKHPPIVISSEILNDSFKHSAFDFHFDEHFFPKFLLDYGRLRCHLRKKPIIKDLHLLCTLE